MGIHAVAQGRVARGEDVLVLGGGSIGLLTAVAAKMAGARAVALISVAAAMRRRSRGIGMR